MVYYFIAGLFVSFFIINVFGTDLEFDTLHFFVLYLSA